MDDDTWHLVKHTNKVTGFVGGAKNRPAPISEAEVDEDRRPDAGGRREAAPQGECEVGEMVRVKEGPFTDFNGAVEEVNYEKSQGPRVGHDLRPRHAGRTRIRQVEKI